jgi:phosphoribosyl-dephospho-CoA transferase
LGDQGRLVFLGLALPPAPEKRRLAFEVPRSCISEVSDPPRCQDCISEDASGSLFRFLSGLGGVSLRAFGSHAWQHLTGLPYVTPGSDIDLLAFIDSKEAWLRLRSALDRVEWPARPRIDLEVVLGRDASFLWREFVAARDDRLLFKGTARIWMGSKNDVSRLLRDSVREPG